MRLQEIIQKALQEKTITPELEAEINLLMWSSELAEEDLKGLQRLLDSLSNGTILCWNDLKSQAATEQSQRICYHPQQLKWSISRA
jgi:hypothetical protein